MFFLRIVKVTVFMIILIFLLMELNSPKSQTLSFLVFFIDESLTCEKHNSYVTNIVSKYSGILFRLKQLLPRSTLFSLYNTLVLPHLYYWNIIWADLNKCNLNSILKRIVRLCTNSSRLAHTPPLFSQLNTLTIYDIQNLTKALIMYNFAIKNLPSNFDHYFVKNSAFHHHATRSAQLFRPAVFKYNLARCTIRTQGPLLWNSLPDNIKCAWSCIVFKKLYKNYLISCISLY